jgi:hypothetical protein
MSHFQPPSCSSGARRKGRSLDFGFPAQKHNFFKGEGSGSRFERAIGREAIGRGKKKATKAL